MSKKLMIAGASGSGKSTSIRTLDPKTTFIINCGKKDLSFPKSRTNYKICNKENPNGNLVNENEFVKVLTWVNAISEKRPEIKTLIIDDQIN